jgi:hypothetical protein
MTTGWTVDASALGERAQLLDDRADRLLLRPVLVLVVQHETHSALTQLVGIAPMPWHRQYFPRKVVDFHAYTQEDLDAVAAELNGRPCKTLEFMTPSAKFNEAVATTH